MLVQAGSSAGRCCTRRGRKAAAFGRAGVYTPETPEFAKQLQNHKDLSFRIENIKEIKLYADAAVSVGTMPPYELVEITFAFDWTQGAASRVSDMPFIVVSPAHFAA